MKRLNMEPRFVKGITILFLGGFIGGILAVNMLGEAYLNQAGILSDYFIRQYKYMEIDMAGLFFYILGKRMKWILLLWLLGVTVAGLPCAAAYTAWMGFSAGTLLSISVLKLGIKGLVFSVGAMVPQELVYIPAWIFFLYGIYRKSRGGVKVRKAAGKNWDVSYFLLLAGMCLFTTFGILMESYLNPWMVKQILKIF